jgi:glycerol kinase
VIRPAQLETTALGVALMAGVVTGVWTDVAATEAAWTPELRITPNGDLEQAYTRWQAARDASIELGRTYAGRPLT